MSCSLPLSCIRSRINSTMHGTAIIYDFGWVADGMGGGTASYTASGTVACTVAAKPIRGNEEVDGGQLVSNQDWWVLVPWDTTVKHEDRVEVASQTYEVEATNDQQTDRTCMTLKCRRIV